MICRSVPDMGGGIGRTHFGTVGENGRAKRQECEVECKRNPEVFSAAPGRGGRLTTLARSFEDVPVRASVRFPLHMEIVLITAERRYTAVTEDVSANGVLFAAEELPEVGAAVEFELKMPAAIMGGVEDVLLRCAGRIIRHQQSGGRSMAAAIIDEYSLKG